jgi:hypothetical protein
MSKQLNIAVLVTARDEYIEQLKCIVVPLLIQGFNSIYSDALRLSNNKKTIYKFQELLKEIPQWNQTILQEESKRIKKKCTYIMDIVTAIFVSNVKILASVRLKGNNDNIRVKIPTSDIFIHSIYIEAAQHIFYDPFLFYHRSSNRSIQECKEQVKNIIRFSVDETIRQMLPFDDILQEYLANALNEDADRSDIESEEDTDSENELNANDLVESEEDYSDSESEQEDEPPKNFNLPVKPGFPSQLPPPPPPEPVTFDQLQQIKNVLPESQPVSQFITNPYSDSSSDSDSDSDSDSSSSSSSDSDHRSVHRSVPQSVPQQQLQPPQPPPQPQQPLSVQQPLNNGYSYF